jgi:hypothetical protein
MASSLTKLTGVGGDVRKIARLLQAKAPAGHKLAYINDEEAALLKSRGGKGTPHADTGIPSYEQVDYTDYDYMGPVEQTPTMDLPTVYYPSGASGQVFDSSNVPPDPGTITPNTYSQTSEIADQYFGPSGTAPQGQIIPAGPLEGQSVYAPIRYSGADLNRISVGKDPLAQFKGQGAALPAPAKEGMSDETMKRLGLAGVIGLLGSGQANKAAEAGRAGQRQMQNIAAPYQQAGAQIQAQAQRGELTPQARQSLQAVQAQAAQGAERRGGVGAQQVQAQVEAFRQQLLQQQYDYGLKLSGIGDNIALGAIKTGLQADQYVNQLTNQYYSNIARVAFGSAPQVPGVPVYDGGQ